MKTLMIKCDGGPKIEVGVWGGGIKGVPLLAVYIRDDNEWKEVNTKDVTISLPSSTKIFSGIKHKKEDFANSNFPVLLKGRSIDLILLLPPSYYRWGREDEDGRFVVMRDYLTGEEVVIGKVK